MSTQVTTKTPKLFIGLDIHKKSWRFHFVTDLFSGSGHTFPPDIDKIYNYVSKNYDGYEVSIAYEVGCFGYKPARAFESFGWDTFVVNPADIPRPSKSKFMKTDKIDAKNIAQQLKAGNLKKITVPNPIRESLRTLTRQRTAVVRDYRRIKTRIKSLLTYHHIKIPDGMDSPKWSLAFLDWLSNLDVGHANTNKTLASMLNQYRYIDQEIKDLSTQIRKYCKVNHKEDYMLLRSVPGIAGLTAGYILSELGDLRRFSSFKKLASYVGFIPSMQQSGESLYSGGVHTKSEQTCTKYDPRSFLASCTHRPSNAELL